jgi:hypothetical protein
MNRRSFLSLLSSPKRTNPQKKNLNFEYVNSLNELRQCDGHLGNSQIIHPLGYSRIGDCNMPRYRWEKENSQSDNSGTIINPKKQSKTGRWVAIIDDYVNVDWFGAGLGNDDSNAIDSALQTGITLRKRIKFSSGKMYKISSAIKSIGTFVIEGTGKLNTIIECYSPGICLDLDGYGCEIRNLHFINKTKKGGTAIKLSGRGHILENIRFGGGFESCIHLIDVWESNFDKINIVNGYPNRTGIGFLVDHSTNNTISNSYLSYNQTAIQFTSKYSPTNYRSEGWLISGSIFIDSQNGIHAEGITHISIHNCIFDFIYKCAIYLSNGFSGIISGNWFSAAAENVSLIITHKSFNGAKVIGNEFVGSLKTLKNQNSLTITSNHNILGGNRHIEINSGKNFGTSNVEISDIHLKFSDL